MERTISSCQLFVFFCFFLWTPFSYGDIVKAEFPYKMCGNIYYWCSVCGCGPVAVALWGTAHLLIGFPAFVPGFFPVWIICLNYWGNDKTGLSYTPDPFACMPVSQNVLYKHLWCFKFDVSCNYQLFILSCWSFFFFTGSSPDATKPERYGTTVPLLLKGKERRPLSQLAARVNAHKATADVWLFCLT